MMFTMKSVCASIGETMDQPMTPESVHILADLLYIKERMSLKSEDQAQRSEDLGGGLTPETAKRWVAGMENADGTRGAHWPMEKTEEVRKQRGVDAEPLEWWVAMNMIYSDYCAVAEKLGTSTAEFYTCMAKAFLDDKDAQPDKLARYYEFIARH